MIRTLVIGYSSASLLGIAGYMLLGGGVWIWGFAVWIGGAIACLLVAGVRLYLRSDDVREGRGEQASFDKSTVVFYGRDDPYG
ncbi:hypothetical protein [uncultured Sulfitobacter sp.]|uniref:hypothetical protein n=1 Tax=uncultured Sulfitobacter sp. TaxID=191468 RepID=UPI0026282CDA|nr:hypothetical protein [uncultured Sulfitobacter sp.]